MKVEKQIGIMLVIIAILLVFGFVGLYIYQEDRYSDVFFEYNGFVVHKVEKQGIPIYQVQLFINEGQQPYLIDSRYDPKELENIGIYTNVKEDIIKEKLFVTMDPNLSSKATIAFSEIDAIMQNPFLFRLPTFPALLEKVEGNDLPIISCNDVNETTSVIKFRTNGDNTIFSEDGCVVLNAIDEDGLIRLADRLVLTVLGVINQ